MCVHEISAALLRAMLSPLNGRGLLVGERFFPIFPKFGNIWRYVSIHGGVTIREILQKKQKINFVKFHILYIYLEKKIRKIWKIEKLRETNVEIMEKTLR